MSSRNMRKLMGGNTLPPPEDDESSDGYQPLYARVKSPFRNAFEGLSVSSSSTEGGEPTTSSEVESDATVDIQDMETKQQKGKQNKGKHTDNDEVANQRSTQKLDEIEQSVKEVNEMLGTPDPPNAAPEAPESPNLLMVVRNKYVNLAYEDLQVFGPLEEDRGKKRGRRPVYDRIAKRGLIIHTERYEQLQKIGLSMSVSKLVDGLTYFTFDHSVEYVNKHRPFAEMVSQTKSRSGFHLEDVLLNHDHPEEMIEMADILFRAEDSSAARKFVEKAIAHMQFASHPLFRLSDPKIRLDYDFVENRMFFVAVLKYIHLLTNTMYHRTALELAKLLVNLDPSDPVGIIFIIDTLALRAREHQWLIDVIIGWKQSRYIEYLVNIKYSYALATFHVAKKQRDPGLQSEEIKKTNDTLQSSIWEFPTVVVEILKAVAPHIKDVATHALFVEAEKISSKCLESFIVIYVKFTAAKWREPEVLSWFIENVREVMAKYDNDINRQMKCTKDALQRKSLYEIWPDELIRHMAIIKSMDKLLLDMTIPHIGTHGVATNPMPVPLRNGINRYHYVYKMRARPYGHGPNSLWTGMMFFMTHNAYPIDADPEDMVLLAEERNSSYFGTDQDLGNEYNDILCERLLNYIRNHSLSEYYPNDVDEGSFSGYDSDNDDDDDYLTDFDDDDDDDDDNDLHTNH